MVPSGKAGKRFVQELTRLFSAYADASAMEGIAIKAAMTACSLLLQKPHSGSKSHDHATALERRLKSWEEGDIDSLMREGRTIQNHFRTNHGKRMEKADMDSHNVRSFTNLMLQGKVHSAMRFLSDNQGSGVLDLDENVDASKTVRDVLAEKHPSGREIKEEALIGNGEEPPTPHPVLFEQLTGQSIRAAALRTQGSAGPSGIDAAGWRRICTGFHRHSSDLCSALARCARRLCTDFVDPQGLDAFLACRLIPLDKNPGVRPIGIREVVRRIVGKAVMAVTKAEVLEAAGPLQLCAGHEAGAEAAVHAMKAIFEDESCDAVMFVDASNAFNNLNRKVALLNIRFICPALSTILINSYRHHASLFVGGAVLLSQEGTTQDPLAMAMFALATILLIQMLSTAREGSKQAWFADDAASGGCLESLRDWWDALVEKGPAFGYYPNAIKTFLVVKSDRRERAVNVFEGTAVQITTEGRRYLGGALGTEKFVQDFIADKVSDWTSEVRRLAKFAATQPQAAYAAYTHGLINRWIYALRVTTPIEESLLKPLEDAVSQKLIPALTGQAAPNEDIRALLALPVQLGGMGLVNPVTLPRKQHRMSLAITMPLVSSIDCQAFRADMAAIKNEQHCKRVVRKEGQNERKLEAEKVIKSVSPKQQRCARAAQEKGTSSWLSVVPIKDLGFALHKRAFRDAIALRYGWPLHLVPSLCRCGEPFEVDHVMSCRHGGFQTLRHNEIRDLLAGLFREVCHDVSVEPCLQPLTGEQFPASTNKSDEARLDIRARGFWGTGRGQQDAFF